MRTKPAWALVVTVALLAMQHLCVAEDVQQQAKENSYHDEDYYNRDPEYSHHDHDGKYRYGACPLWPPDAVDQGQTSADRPAAPSSNIFAELSVEEYNAVLTYLFSFLDLALQDPTNDRTLVAVNYVHAITMEIPPKSEVLAYLDGTGPKPARKARAVLVLGLANPPLTREVLVTLEHSGGKVTASNLEAVDLQSSKQPYLPYPTRPQSDLDQNGVDNAIAVVQDTLNLFLADAFDGFTYGDACNGKCIACEENWARAFHQPDIAWGAYGYFYWYTGDGTGDGNTWVQPIPLQGLFAATGRRLENWRIYKLWFNGCYFDSVDELWAAWQADADGIRSSFTYRFPVGDESLYSNFRPRPGPKRGEQQPVGPTAWEPYGRRWTITDGNKVQWLGWSLFVGYVAQYGPRFWDIRFKGERVAYEISMQEALAQYGADDLSQSPSLYLDSAFGLGATMRELVQGVDCPMNAAFMDATYFFGFMSGPTVYSNTICVFEHNPETPVLRHEDLFNAFYGGAQNSNLVIRMISVVYNYDYVMDLILSVDGNIEVRASLSGYIQATARRSFYPYRFGNPIFYNVSGTVHTHVLAWKADLDIAGRDNSVNLLCFETEPHSDGAGGTIIMNTYRTRRCEVEEDSGMVVNMDRPMVPVVINEQAHNKWGIPRGYKVQLNRPLKNIQPGVRQGNERAAGLGFWNWNFVATKYRDHESLSSYYTTVADMANPPTTLADYVNGDSIQQEDVVVWVNSGLYHVPSSEDAPVTPTGQNTLSFSLVPFNWADENPTTDMADMIQIDDTNLDSIVPPVKTAVGNCTPNYTNTQFGANGSVWDGFTFPPSGGAAGGKQRSGSGAAIGHGRRCRPRHSKRCSTGVVKQT